MAHSVASDLVLYCLWEWMLGYGSIFSPKLWPKQTNFIKYMIVLKTDTGLLYVSVEKLLL